jgi:PIN domain nuclease of toxin-antitoxin system
LIEIPDNERFFSIASIWEITIKASLGRLAAPMPPNILVRDHVWANGVILLPISTDHLDTLHALPYHHKDPFDRLIAAQAIQEKMILITRDQAFNDYGVRVAWASPSR